MRQLKLYNIKTLQRSKVYLNLLMVLLALEVGVSVYCYLYLQTNAAFVKRLNHFVFFVGYDVLAGLSAVLLGLVYIPLINLIEFLRGKNTEEEPMIGNRKKRNKKNLLGLVGMFVALGGLFLPSMCFSNYNFLKYLPIPVLVLANLPALIYGFLNYSNKKRQKFLVVGNIAVSLCLILTIRSGLDVFFFCLAMGGWLLALWSVVTPKS